MVWLQATSVPYNNQFLLCINGRIHDYLNQNKKIRKLKSDQFCLEKLRNIKSCAEDHDMHHIASHPPTSASAHCAITVGMGTAYGIESEIIEMLINVIVRLQ